MMKRFLLFLGLLFFIVNAQAYNRTMAQDFLVACKKPKNMDVCRAYISGVVDDIFSYYSINDHHNLRVFTKNMQQWNAEKIRAALLQWAKGNKQEINNKSAADMVNQFLYSVYVKPSASPCGG